MKTIRIKIYSFNELSQEAQQKAINKYREEIETDFIYDEAYKTVKKFNQLFNLKEGRNSWLNCNTNNIEDAILELKGFRLQKYIYNNFGYTLFKNAWFGSLKSDEVFTHPRIRSKKLNNGKTYNPYYSAIKKNNGQCFNWHLLR